MNKFRDKTDEFPLKAPFKFWFYFYFVVVQFLSLIQLFETPWTVGCQAPLSVEFSRKEHWSGLPFPSPSDLPNSGIEPGPPELQADSLLSEPLGKSKNILHFSVSRASLLRHGAKCVKVFRSLSLECEFYHFCLDDFYQGRTNTHKARMLVGVLRTVRTLLPNKLPPPWSANCG